MRQLLYKEWKLVALPVVYLFALLAFLLLTPGYPYSMVFFFTCLSIFQSVLSARENRDVQYMAALPVPKKDVVKARYLLVLSIEWFHLLCCVPFALVRALCFPYPNAAGIEANLAFFAEGILVFSIFNRVFLGCFFRDVYRVGTAFWKASLAAFPVLLLTEASVHIAAALWGSCFWDSLAPADQLRQLPFLAISLAVFFLSTLWGYRRDKRHFEKQDV